MGLFWTNMFLRQEQSFGIRRHANVCWCNSAANATLPHLVSSKSQWFVSGVRNNGIVHSAGAPPTKTIV